MKNLSKENIVQAIKARRAEYETLESEIQQKFKDKDLILISKNLLILARFCKSYQWDIQIHKLIYQLSKFHQKCTHWHKGQKLQKSRPRMKGKSAKKSLRIKMSLNSAILTAVITLGIMMGRNFSWMQ